MAFVIPKRFSQAVDNHIVGNLLDFKDYPLILSIFGEPGVGKTFQLREHLKTRGFVVHSVNAADLESDHAGEPTKLLRREYIAASEELARGYGAAIVIDDIDTTLGEWKDYTGTVNHQDLLAFFMHVADSPTKIENMSDDLSRVPIFFTGNDLEKLYAPLRRPGRMNVFEYVPTDGEKYEVVCAIFGAKHSNEILDLIKRHPDKPISYYSNARATAIARMYNHLVGEIDFSQLASNESYRKLLKAKFKHSFDTIEWSDYSW